MHYKYSGMLNTAYIAMMYGGGMPILFPIAAAQLIVLYIIENYKFYRCYTQPPAYDEKLNKFCLNKLEKAPLILLAFSYWIYSNKQILQKKEWTNDSLLNNLGSIPSWSLLVWGFQFERLVCSRRTTRILLAPNCLLHLSHLHLGGQPNFLHLRKVLWRLVPRKARY